MTSKGILFIGPATRTSGPLFVFFPFLSTSCGEHSWMTYHFFGRYVRITVLEIMVEVLDFTFVETASLQFEFPEQQNSKLMHSDSSIVRPVTPSSS